MTEICVGIIGSGYMGRTHAEAMKKYVTGVRLVAVAGGSRAPLLAKDYNIEAEQSVEALVKKRDVDSVVIATPHSVHVEQTVLAAENGKHVFVEKPMATTLEGCDRMIQACRKAGVNLMVGHFQRYRKVNSLAKNLIDEGKIGGIMIIRETMISPNGIRRLPPWQRKPENVGTLIGYGIHAIDRVLWWVGERVRTIFACCGAYREEVPVEVSSLLLMVFKNGVTATLLSCYECPPPGFPKSLLRAQVIREKGLLDVDAYGKLQLGVGNSWKLVYEQPRADFRHPKAMFSPVRMEAYGLCDQEFVNSIVEARAPTIPGEQGKDSVEVATAAYRSSKLNRAVNLPL